MRKIYSILLGAFMLFALAACQPKEKEIVIVEKQVEKIVEVLVEVPVEVIVEVPGQVDRYNRYQPGSYYKTKVDKDGNQIVVGVFVNNYGRIENVYIDETTVQNRYLYDDETERLYIFVQGITDIVQNSYRLVRDGRIPTNQDALTTDDLIVGYPLHDARIRSLESIDANETRRIVDFNNSQTGFDSYSNQFSKVADKVVSDQTTFGIRLYQSGNEEKTSSISGVDLPVGEEVKLIQDILDNDAKLTNENALLPASEKESGIYREGLYFGASKPIINEDGVVYDFIVLAANENGKLTHALLDRTSNTGGVASTVMIDDNFQNQDLNNLSTRIVRNGGLRAFKFVDLSNNREVDLTDLNDAKYSRVVDYKYTRPFAVKGFENVVMNGYFEAFGEIVQASPDIEEGLYYVKDELNNTLYLGINANGVIDAISFDRLQAGDNAFVTVDGREYELFTFEKGWDDFSLEIHRDTVLIYRDGNDYRYLNDSRETNDRDREYRAGRVVDFSDKFFDERGTISRVQANNTLRALDPNSDEAMAYEKFGNFFLGKTLTDIYTVNFLDDGKTDSIKGVDIKVTDLFALLIQGFDAAKDEDNRVVNAVEFAANGSNDGFLGNYKIGRGSFVGSSIAPTEDGGFNINTFLTDVNGQIRYITFDETIFFDGELTTKVLLGDDYTVENRRNETPSDARDAIKYDQYIVRYVLGSNNINGTASPDASNGYPNSGELAILDRYDYELRTEFDEDDSIYGNDTDLIDNYEVGSRNALLAALQRRVLDTFEDVTAAIKETLSADDFFVVASDGTKTKEIDLKTGDVAVIGSAGSTPITIDIDADSDDRDLDIDTKSGEDFIFELIAEEDIPRSANVGLLFDLEFDDYDTVSYEDFVRVFSIEGFKEYKLNEKTPEGVDINRNLGFDATRFVSGETIELKLPSLQNVTPKDSIESFTGNGNDVHPLVQYRVSGLNDTFAYAASIELTNTIVGQTLTITGASASIVDGKLVFDNVQINGTNGQTFIFVDKGVEYTIATGSSILNNANNSFGTLTISRDGETVSDSTTLKILLSSFLEITNNETVHPSASDTTTPTATGSAPSFKVITAAANDTGNITVKAFFDAYEQRDRDGQLGTWQRGEANRDFNFEVLGATQAARIARQEVSVGNILDTITTEREIDLSDQKDLNINGAGLLWLAFVDNMRTAWFDGSSSDADIDAYLTTTYVVDVVYTTTSGTTTITDTHKGVELFRDDDVSTDPIYKYIFNNRVYELTDPTLGATVSVSGRPAEAADNNVHAYYNGVTTNAQGDITGIDISTDVEKNINHLTDAPRIITRFDENGSVDTFLKLRQRVDKTQDVTLTTVFNGITGATNLTTEFLIARLSASTISQSIKDNIEDRFNLFIDYTDDFDGDTIRDIETSIDSISGVGDVEVLFTVSGKKFDTTDTIEEMIKFAVPSLRPGQTRQVTLNYTVDYELNGNEQDTISGTIRFNVFRNNTR